MSLCHSWWRGWRETARGTFGFWRNGVLVTAFIVGPDRDDSDVQAWLEEVVASTRV